MVTRGMLHIGDTGNYKTQYSVTQSKGHLGKLLELAHAPQPYFGVRPSNAKPRGALLI
jgi:hypothetical protein